MHGPGKIRVSKSGCLGRCNSGPCIVIYPEGIWYSYSSFEDIDRIIESHLLGGIQVSDLLMIE
jgi:(2Fe-2S) ferredoxin